MKLIANQIFSGIREIWIRNVYLKDGFIKIPDAGVIIDLGANVGTFTMLGLANSNRAYVISVEPNAELNRMFLKQINYNNFGERVNLQRFFIGLHSSKQTEMLKNPSTANAKFISQKEFIEINNLKKIEFLKCDIEGSEFEFIKDTSLLQITDQLAIEIHDFAGNRTEFISKLKLLGFIIGPIKNDSESCILLAKKI
ncbi:MAG: FkbM family methyltransferase [Ignavibacteriaceae bacterium]